MEEDRRSTNNAGMKHLLSLLLAVFICLNAKAQITDDSIPSFMGLTVPSLVTNLSFMGFQSPTSILPSKNFQ